jgi:hypothetical protein
VVESVNKARDVRRIEEADSPQNKHISKAMSALQKVSEELTRFLAKDKSTKKDDVSEAIDRLTGILLTPST